MDSSGWLELVKFKTCQLKSYGWNPNFFRKICFQLAQILDLPNFSQEEGGEDLDTKKIVPEGEDERPDDLAKVSLERKVRVWLITRSWILRVFSRENISRVPKGFSFEEGESASSVQPAEYLMSITWNWIFSGSCDMCGYPSKKRSDVKTHVIWTWNSIGPKYGA